MQLVNIDTWTGTPGTHTGALVRYFPKKVEISGVSNWPMFEDLLASKDNYAKNYRRLHNRLLALDTQIQTKLRIPMDAIEYLAFLYYGDNNGQAPRSIEMISDYLKDEFGFIYSKSALQHLFSDILGWELRDKAEITETTAKRHRAKLKANPAVADGNRKYFDGERKKVAEKVDTLLAQMVEESYGFDLLAYLEAKKGFDKIKIVFEALYEKDVYTLIFELASEGYKAPTIAQIINDLTKNLILVFSLPIREYPETSKNAIAYILKSDSSETRETQHANMI